MPTASKAKQLAGMGVLLGLIMVLTTVEHMLAPGHFKPGLANIVVMYAVFVLGGHKALALNCLKAAFVFVTRGAVAGLLSLSGGVLSVVVIIALAGMKKHPPGYAAISVSGAVAHNLGQFAVVIFIMGTPLLVYYVPVLVGFGVAAGLLTGALLKLLMPVLVRGKLT